MPLQTSGSTSQAIQTVETAKEDYKEYPDGGVKYAGYARRPLGNGQFSLIRQETRFISVFDNVFNLAGTTLYTVPANKVFYVDEIDINFKYSAAVAASAMRLFDSVASNPKFQFGVFSSTSGFAHHDLKNCPRKFTSSVLLDFDIANNLDFMGIWISGWLEDA